MPTPRTLSTKQALFVAHYLGNAHGNATEAARLAGYKNPESASKDNMANPIIREFVKDYVEKQFASANEVLAELTDVGMAEWRDFVIIKIDPETGEQIPVKLDLNAKVKSLELLGKYHQLFTDNIQHQGAIDIQIAGINVDDL